MSLQLYQRVALKIDLLQYGLRAGDVATLVDLVPHPDGPSKPRGCILEVFNALGDSIAVITVPETSVQLLRADEVLAVRPLAKAG
jgi:hypothetical protein